MPAQLKAEPCVAVFNEIALKYVNIEWKDESETVQIRSKVTSSVSCNSTFTTKFFYLLKATADDRLKIHMDQYVIEAVFFWPRFGKSLSSG